MIKLKNMFFQLCFWALMVIQGFVYLSCRNVSESQLVMASPKIFLELASVESELGQVLAPINVLNQGGDIVVCTTEPLLPVGLTINPLTCEISGIPAVATNQDYTVLATNSAGSSRATLNLVIRSRPPQLSLATSRYNLIQGVGAIARIPINSGGAITSCSSSPTLPIGLSLNSQTCQLEGRPTEVTQLSNYQITASNSGGVSSYQIQIKSQSAILAMYLGQHHSCANQGGYLRCWGSNSYGQLGYTTLSSVSLLPQEVIGLGYGVESASLGAEHTCALKRGAVWCWGENSLGQLGINSSTSSLAPQLVSTLEEDVTQIVSGYYHNCALKNGGVWCWGYNHRGQLGDGTTTNRAAPVAVIGLSSGVQSIYAYGSHTCAIQDGAAKCWGFNGNGQLGNNTQNNSMLPVDVVGLSEGVVQLALGLSHTCALKNGWVACWGSGTSGQLGQEVSSSLVPLWVNEGVSQIAAGAYHTCTLEGGWVGCWGLNTHGQLGDGTNITRHLEVAVITQNVQNIYLGANYSCAFKDADVQCWGQNNLGQLGLGTSSNGVLSPQPSSLFSIGVTKVAVGFSHTCALKAGALWCWGSNGYGQLGVGNLIEANQPQLVNQMASGVSDFSLGRFSTCAIKNGKLSCWGANWNGQLGLGSLNLVNHTEPVELPIFPGGNQRITHISMGYSHGCAIKDGALYCWGSNTNGELGNGGVASSQLVPVAVLSMADNVTQVSTKWPYTTCALKNKELYCWGRADGGRSLLGYTQDQSSPVLMGSLNSGIQGFVRGWNQSCVIVNGALKCWGWAPNLGLGHFDQTLIGLSDVLNMGSGIRSIASGNNHSCAIKNGQLFCWGSNTNYQLGLGVGPNQHTAQRVQAGDVDFSNVQIGLDHSCSLAFGQIYCWGPSTSQLGYNPADEVRYYPKEVANF